MPDKSAPEAEKTMNHYLASQMVAERQAALAAEVTHRAQLKEARAARQASAPTVGRPARTRWQFLRRLSHAGA
jgi:hypothetical protein